MKRSHLVSAPLVVIALMLSACGSSGPKTLSQSDFVTQMNAICHTEARALTNLDPTAKSFYTDANDTIQTSLDALNLLKPPASLKSNFDDYVSNAEALQTQIAKLGKAVKAKDQPAAKTATDKLDKLSKTNDGLAGSLGTDKCVDLGNAAAVTTGTTETTGPTDTTGSTAPATTQAPTTTSTRPPTTTTAPSTTTPRTTAPPTTAPPTTVRTPNTPLPIDTGVNTVPSTSQTGTVPAGAIVPTDASVDFHPIPGYSWVPYSGLETAPIPNDAVLAPVLAAYAIGEMKNDADGSLVFVDVTILTTSAAWTKPQLDAYYSFEIGAAATDQIIPGLNLPGRIQLNVSESLDAGGFTIDGNAKAPAVGLSVFAKNGSDIPGLLKSFASAQSSMAG
jgi:hypothetical protein